MQHLSEIAWTTTAKYRKNPDKGIKIYSTPNSTSILIAGIFQTSINSNAYFWLSNYQNNDFCLPAYEILYSIWSCSCSCLGFWNFLISILSWNRHGNGNNSNSSKKMELSVKCKSFVKRIWSKLRLHRHRTIKQIQSNLRKTQSNRY